ncbi:hypothetical protein FRX31_031676, partial [Thalictrum thalictroides]
MESINALTSKVESLNLRNPVTPQLAQIDEPTCEQCQMVGHTLNQCPFPMPQEQACATYGRPYNRNHPGFQWSNPGGSATPAQLYARDSRGSQPVYNQTPQPTQIQQPGPGPSQKLLDPNVMFQILLEQNKAQQQLLENFQKDMTTRMENLENKHTFPAQPVINPKGILPRPNQAQGHEAHTTAELKAVSTRSKGPVEKNVELSPTVKPSKKNPSTPICDPCPPKAVEVEDEVEDPERVYIPKAPFPQ